MPIHELKGDATSPTVPGNKIIAHSCNNIGGWGAGFVMALSKKWLKPEIYYRRWADSFLIKHGNLLPLGACQIVQVEEDTFVANIIGQNGIREIGNPHPVDYNALMNGFFELADFAGMNDASIHMPRIGCGLGGGKWERVEDIINKTLSSLFDVYVYDLE